MSVLPSPEQTTIGEHLRQRHGYDLATTVALHPVTLCDEHDRIHVHLSCDHEHERHDDPLAELRDD